MGFHGDLNMETPFYVTRKTAKGETASLSLSIWMQLLVVLLAWLNAVGWSIYGLVNLVGHLIEVF